MRRQVTVETAPPDWRRWPIHRLRNIKRQLLFTEFLPSNRAWPPQTTRADGGLSPPAPLDDARLHYVLARETRLSGAPLFARMWARHRRRSLLCRAQPALSWRGAPYASGRKSIQLFVEWGIAHPGLFASVIIPAVPILSEEVGTGSRPIQREYSVSAAMAARSA